VDSVPSYFDDEAAATKLREEALSWIDTPFREYYQQELERISKETGQTFDVKGMGGGIDCIGLLQEVFARTGASDKFVFPRSPADYQSHQTGDKILDWFRGKVDDPQSWKLAEILTELELPAGLTNTDLVTPRDFFKTGDIVILRKWSLFHLPLIIDENFHFVNAIPRMGVIEGTIQDSTFRRYIVAVFRLKPNELVR
jgi:hypothetical protein